MPLEIIGAGLSRTGTLSLKLALKALGFGPCFHMMEFIKPEYAPRRTLWEALRDGAEPDWEVMFDGFASAVDAPAQLYYRRLASAYPEAKVILTVRDAANWYRSSVATVWAAGSPGQSSPEASERGAKIRAATIREIGFDILENPRDEAVTTRLFDRYNEQVKRDIPAERLLVFDVATGWTPLCEFLGVAVPQAPFPRENATADFSTRFGSSRLSARSDPAPRG